MTYAPRDVSQTLKVAAAWRKTTETRRCLQALMLVVMIDIPAGCESVGNVLDLWNHPLLKPKCKDIVSGVQVLTPQMQMVITGYHGPIHTQKHCVAITLDSSAYNQSEPEFVIWRDTIGRTEWQIAHRRCPRESSLESPSSSG